MKRNLFYLLMMVCSLSIFVSCKDDDDTPGVSLADGVAGGYKGDLQIAIPLLQYDSTSTQNITLSKVGENKLKLELNDFSFPVNGIALNLGNIIVNNIPLTQNGETVVLTETQVPVTLIAPINDVKVTVSGTITGKVADLKIDVTEAFAVNTVNVTFKGEKTAFNGEALIKEMTFADHLVTVQPQIDGKNITFQVPASDTLYLVGGLTKLIPTITVSDGAKVEPASGSIVDFSKGPVTFTVTSEDGENQSEYVVSCVKKSVYSFSNWEEAFYEGEDLDYTDPKENGWATSNQAAYMLVNMGLWDNGPYAVTAEEKGYQGKGALLYTADTKGIYAFIAAVPKVTAASLFMGKFILNATETLKSTCFGVPFYSKPTTVKGYYKYNAGETYYTTIITGSGFNTVVSSETVPGMIDSCALTAVLYEVPDYTDEMTLNGESLFDFSLAPEGLKVVAFADFYSQSASEFTPFELKLNYLQDYDPSKKYKFSVICSPSKNGAKYEGCPGSKLSIDEVEVWAE